MDVIFHIDYANNLIGSAFCTLDEQSYRTGSGGMGPDTIATFAIRFYGWTASLFADWDFTGSKNAHFDPKEMFAPLVRALEPCLFDEPTLAGKARMAEAFLLRRLCSLRPENDLLNAVHYLLATSGREPVSELCGYAGVSPRKLERLFQRHMGISPKSFASLARYQMLWQELAGRPQLSLLDAVAKYGYTDQAHLLHDFKRRHLMTPSEALLYAGISRPDTRPIR
jgi:AraC-like DNA-binding protein